MGHFDETKCDCCVCPMQCVLKQLIGPEINIDTTSRRITTTITGVNDFIVSTSDEGIIPVCQISHVSIEDPTTTMITLKPIRKSTGDCACCEDPTTNALKSEIGNTVDIDFFGNPFSFPLTDQILNVGEGIVVGFNSQFNFLDIYSTCAITQAR